MTRRHNRPGENRANVKSRPASIAKITRPELAEVFLRTRLFRVLDHERKRKVIWVSGPPGAGKTTLVASYLSARRLSGLWYQMDEGDSDPATFFYYLGLAARKAAPRHRAPLPPLTPEYLPGLATFSRRYFENLFGRLPRPFAIVLDNYHEVPAESRLHEVICEGLLNLPKGGRVIVISRAAPPPGLARLRANQALEMIGWEELQLTGEELKGLVHVLRPGRLSEKAIRALYGETEGWAAGVVLMLEHTRTEHRETLSLGQPVREAIFDYFAGEILGKTDVRTRDFLLRTAFLPRMTVRMAERLSGMNDAGAVLSDMNRRNYFTIRLAEAEPIYQYHDLFREFLQMRAGEAYGPAQLAQVQQQAASVLEASGQIESALELYGKAGDWIEAMRLILKSARSMVDEGRGGTLEDWIGRLPRERVDENPWLLYWMGVCRLSFELSQSRRHLERAFALFETQADDPSGLFLSWCGMVDTFVYEWGNFTPLDRWIAALENLLARYPEFPSPEIGARVAAGMFCALMYRQPHHPKIGEWEERVKGLILESPDEAFRMMIGHHLLLYYTWWLADLGKARVLINALRPTEPSPEMAPLMMITWYAIEGAYDWMTASHEACLKTVSNGLEIARKNGVHVWDFMLLAQSVHSLLSTDQFETAREKLGEMRKILNAHPTRRLDWAHYHYLMIWETLGRNDLSQALAEAERCLAHVLEAGVPFVEGVFHTGVGHVMLRLHRLDRAASHLARAREIAHKIGSTAVEYLYLLLEAEFGLFYGDEASGLEALRKLMALAREHAIFNHGGWQNPQMARICMKALEAGIEVDHVQQLIRRRNLMPEDPPLECETWPWPIKIHTLGRFSVLRDGRPLRFTGKVQRKPLELLQALIAYGGREVREDQLVEALWPDAEGDAAHRSFATTLHRLRRLVGDDAALVLTGNRLSLDPRRCWVDVWALERLLGTLETTLRQASAGLAPDALGRISDRALALYPGPFLGDDPAYPWAASLRERLRSRLLRHLDEIGRHWERTAEWEKAAAVYRRGLELDDLTEGFYQRLMICYQCLGRPAEGLATYQRCRRTLSASLGVEPSPETEAICRALRPQ